MKDIDYIDQAISQLKIERPKNLKVNIVEEQDIMRSTMIRQQSYMKRKYRLALQLSAMMDIHEFADTHPEWGVKDVLVEIMKHYYSDFPPSLVLEMAQYIVTEWEKVQASKKELVVA